MKVTEVINDLKLMIQASERNIEINKQKIKYIQDSVCQHLNTRTHKYVDYDRNCTTVTCVECGKEL